MWTLKECTPGKEQIPSRQKGKVEREQGPRVEGRHLRPASGFRENSVPIPYGPNFKLGKDYNTLTDESSKKEGNKLEGCSNWKVKNDLRQYAKVSNTWRNQVLGNLKRKIIKPIVSNFYSRCIDGYMVCLRSVNPRKMYSGKKKISSWQKGNENTRITPLTNTEKPIRGIGHGQNLYS